MVTNSIETINPIKGGINYIKRHHSLSYRMNYLTSKIAIVYHMFGQDIHNMFLVLWIKCFRSIWYIVAMVYAWLLLN